MKKLTRSRSNKKVAGVLGGIAERYGLNANLLRIIFLIALIPTSGGLLFVYLLLVFLLSKEGDSFRD
ncbi:PspC domain-containing protein [Bacillus sp. FJAT-42376]|uniref:PspC domain-containing protein n=1 Tax=Bacillus sp. FJAT-42376 TaxID=2014076 RepID=UPI000F506025|nr:PspC domain-containing protein [Bacillus sp. FJAT-42376]AZB44452.1 PspC domain-containing protein [Bacillus sp. FJAT-42376]